MCHGVIDRIAPEARVVDLSHSVEPFDVLHGALVNADALAYVREGVHVAVVDPGVGGARRPVAVRDRSGRVHVGPDNGVLALAVDRFGGPVQAVTIEADAYLLERPSMTFHARDVFAPAAAHLAAGLSLTRLGEPFDVESLATVTVPAATVGDGLIEATIVLVDRFGNLALSAVPGQLAQAGFREGDLVRICGPPSPVAVTIGATFASVEQGGLVLYEDSFSRLAIAVRQGSGARRLSAGRGDRVALERID